MADSMVMVAPVDLLSIIHQAAERPIPPQLFGAGEVVTPELQAQMLELHLQRKQLMVDTAQQLHKLQQQMQVLHSAAACDGSSQHGMSAWQPPVEESSAAAAAVRHASCSGAESPATAAGTQQQAAAEHSSSAVCGTALPAMETSPKAAGSATDTVASGTVRPLGRLHQPGAAAGAAADGARAQDAHPGSSAQHDTEQACECAAELQHPQPPHGSVDMQQANAADNADAAQQPVPQQQPPQQSRRSPAHASEWFPAQSRAHRRSQQQRERTAFMAPAMEVKAASAAASQTSVNPNRYAMLPEVDSHSKTSSLHDAAAGPSNNEGGGSSAAVAALAAAASAASAPSDGAYLADAAVQTPRLPMLPTANAVISPAASGTCIAVTAADTAAVGKPGAVAPGNAVDLSPPHPSTPRQPADGIAGSSTGSAAVEDGIVSSFQGRADCFHSAAGPGSSSVAADDDSASQSTPAASLASASDDGNGTRAERQRQRQRAKQGRQRAAKRLEAERQQAEEALLAAAAKERAKGLAEQQHQQRQREERLLNESAALQASLRREQDAQRQKRQPAEGPGRQMPLFAVRPMLDGSCGSSSVGAFRFDFPVPKQQME